MATLAQHHTAALRNPCFEAEECRNPIFYDRLPRPFDHVSIGLTVNIGLE